MIAVNAQDKQAGRIPTFYSKTRIREALGYGIRWTRRR